MAGATYYHCKIIDFLDNHCPIKNKLTAAISGDLKEVLFQACIRALGIMGKLITGPLLRLVEDP